QTQQRQGHMRERRQISTCPNRALLGNCRNDSLVPRLNHPLHWLQTDARMTRTKSQQLDKERESRNRFRHDFTHATCMRDDVIELQLFHLLWRYTRLTKRAETRIDSVDISIF